MNNANKVSSKYKLASFVAFTLIILTVQSKNKVHLSNSFHNYLTAIADTIKPGKRFKLPPVINVDTLPQGNKIVKSDSSFIVEKKDTTDLKISKDTIDIKVSKDSLDAILEYNAEDSMILDVPSKKITLYGTKTTTQYKDANLSAPIIEFDQATGNITASIKRDSSGKVIALPTFTQADFTSQSDSIRFNMKTGKGVTKSTYTQQGEMYVYGETIKKFNNDVFFANRARITTCDLDTPHFAFVSNRMKLVSQKLAITGPVHPEFEGVPIPVYLPFGIYPLSQGRHSGFLAPQFASNQQLGLGLEGLGYYKVLSDYWDVIVRGNIYSYGGWTLNVNPKYTRKYRYNGNISLNVQNFKQNFKGDPDYSKNKSYNVQWSHSVDSKARPGVSFSANVNAGSSSFNRYVPDNPYKNFSNQLNSSIVYSKTGTLEGLGEGWKDKPYNLTISANHNQNTNQNLININLPDVAFNLSTLYPFRKKEAVGTPKWFENIGIGYNGNAKSLFSFYDTTENIFKHILDTFQWGAHHSIPISLSLPPLGAFQVGPSVSYEETWYQRKFIRSWNTAKNKVDTTITRGFYTARQMSFGLGISTRIYGLFTSKNKDAKIQAIRHEITPTLSFNFNPDFNKQNYYITQIDTMNNKAQFSVFEGNVFGPYGTGRFGGLGFGIDNNLQMKVRNKKDTGENAIKKISIIDGLSINGNYNLFADSFALSNLNLHARSSLFNNKVSITAGAQIDPYDVDASGRRLKTLLWKRKPLSFGRLVNGNVSLSSQFTGGDKSKNASTKPDLRTNDYPRGYSTDEYQNELAYVRNNPGEFADFNIPWSVNLSYALRFDRVFKSDYSGFKTNFNQDVTFGGTLNLTPKWQMGINGFYNITEHQLGTISVSISREMHCWQMSINLSPVGRYRFYSINISPKSGLLKDLRVNRTRSFYSGF
ncbi:MAG: putative LPS assembly protein LptD [Chitinophagaceae bacterium]